MIDNNTKSEILKSIIDNLSDNDKNVQICSFEDAINNAKHGGTHLRRIRKDAWQLFERKLLENKHEIVNSHSFLSLFNTVSNIGYGIKYIGELTIYDTSMQLGYWLNLFPDNVFVHAGTRKGAKLFNMKINRNNKNKKATFYYIDANTIKGFDFSFLFKNILSKANWADLVETVFCQYYHAYKIQNK